MTRPLFFLPLPSSCAALHFSGCPSEWLAFPSPMLYRFEKVFLALGPSRLFFSPGNAPPQCSCLHKSGFSLPPSFSPFSEQRVSAVNRDSSKEDPSIILLQYSLLSVMTFVMICNSVLTWLFVTCLDFSAPQSQRPCDVHSPSHPLPSTVPGTVSAVNICWMNERTLSTQWIIKPCQFFLWSFFQFAFICLSPLLWFRS